MSEGFRERLRRLRREESTGGGAPRGIAGDERLTERERRLLGRRGGSAARSSDAQTGVDLRPGSPDVPRDFARFERSEGELRARVSSRAASGTHGAWRLDWIGAADARLFGLLTSRPELAGLDLSRAVFLDTETTGLAGGAGTVVFQVGLGRFRAGAFELWQGMLFEPEEERALLAETAERIADASCIVSFFGKSFDRHRLEDRMRMLKLAPPFEGLPHLDLYHPLRRLYAAALPDSRLATMERALCGVARVDDLPGAFAPAAWYDFLAGRPHRLEGVLEHNALDVLSLVTLAAHLGRATRETRPDGAPLEGCGLERARGLAKSYARDRLAAEACAWFRRALARASQPERRLRFDAAEALHRAGASGEARALYETLVDCGDARLEQRAARILKRP